MLEIVQIETDEQLEAYRRLMDEFKAWDMEVSRSLGLDLEELIKIGYHAPVTTFPEAFAPPDGRLLLASYADEAVGCGGLRKLNATVGEIKRLYVRPGLRGKGIGRGLMERLIGDARAIGYGSLRLNTASFMTEAQALYHSLGFKDIAPYYEVPEAFKAFEVFMEIGL